jgi:iron(III) transport system permease protein
VDLVQTDGVMNRTGLDLPWVTHLILGPVGVVLLLGLRCVPFAFLAISAALVGLGQEFDDAARVHGATRLQSLRLILPIIAPAIFSALAIGFVESVSDFGVAATLAYTANFPLATYSLYEQINAFPPSFPGAAAMGWLLIASVALPLTLQARALRGRSYSVLSGRTRQAVRRPLSFLGGIAAIGGIGLFYIFALGIPALGAACGSLLSDYGASFHVSWANYSAVFHNGELFQPLLRSARYGVITASITVVAGFIVARLLTKVRSKAVQALDFLLLAAIAIPSVLFAAGYIFAYNLPILSRFGINLYQTQTLLVIAYAASSLPLNARVLVGAVSQLQGSLLDAGRVHGAGPVRAWIRGVFPIMSRPLLAAWLLTFTGVFLELPISQLLYAPSNPPVSIAIEDNLGNYHFGLGLAQAVVAVAFALLVVGAALGAYRLLAPKGWRRLGEATDR